MLHTITLNVGTQFTTAARSTIFFSLYPLFTVLFGHFWLSNDRLTATKTLGIITAFSGVFLAIMPNLQGGSVTGYLIGDLIVILSACFLGLPHHTDKSIRSGHLPLPTPRLALSLKHSLLLRSQSHF